MLQSARSPEVEWPSGAGPSGRIHRQNAIGVGNHNLELQMSPQQAAERSTTRGRMAYRWEHSRPLTSVGSTRSGPPQPQPILTERGLPRRLEDGPRAIMARGVGEALSGNLSGWPSVPTLTGVANGSNRP